MCVRPQRITGPCVSIWCLAQGYLSSTCPGTSPCYQQTIQILSTLRIEPATLHFTAQSPTGTTPNSLYSIPILTPNLLLFVEFSALKW